MLFRSPIKFYISPPGVADAFATNKYLTTVDVSSKGEYAVEFTLKRRAGLTFDLDVEYPNDMGLSRLIAYHLYGEDADRKAQEEVYAKYLRTKKYDFPQVRIRNVRVEGPYNVQVHPLSFDEEQIKKHIGPTQVGEKFRDLHKMLGLKNNTITQLRKKNLI